MSRAEAEAVNRASTEGRSIRVPTRGGANSADSHLLETVSPLVNRLRSTEEGRLDLEPWKLSVGARHTLPNGRKDRRADLKEWKGLGWGDRMRVGVRMRSPSSGGHSQHEGRCPCFRAGNQPSRKGGRWDRGEECMKVSGGEGGSTTRVRGD